MRPLVLPLLLAALLITVRLTAPNDIKAGDQGKSAQYVLHAWRTGELLVPLERGSILPTKPPLGTWTGLVSAIVAGGPTETALRLPSAVAGLLLVLLTVLLARRIAPEPVPTISGLAVAGNYLFLKSATVIRPDMLLALCVLASIWAAVRALDGGGKRFGLLAFLFAGLGVLAKGPVAPLVVALAILPWAWLRRDRPSLRRLAPLPGALVLLAVAAAWAVPAFLQRGMELWRVMVVTELGRHTTGPGEPVYQYLFTFPGRFLPWVFLLPVGIVIAWRSRRSDAEWRLGLPLLWFALSFVAMSLLGSKRADYLLPILPAAAILAASGLDAASRRAEKLGIGLFAVVLLGTALAFHVLQFAGPTIARDFARRATEAVPAGRSLLVHRTGSWSNALLFHLGRAERPVKLETVTRSIAKDGDALVATTPGGEERLVQAGLEVRRILAESDRDGAPVLVLLEVRAH